jgi:hypothetical protein
LHDNALSPSSFISSNSVPTSHSEVYPKRHNFLLTCHFSSDEQKTETKAADSQTPAAPNPTTAPATAASSSPPTEGSKRDSQENLPQGTIGLKNALVSDYYHDEQHPHCIVIVSSTRVFYLSASSERRQREWMKELLNQPIEFGITLFDAKARLSMVVKPSCTLISLFLPFWCDSDAEIYIFNSIISERI